MRPRAHSRGMSLVEVLTVAVIIGILCAIAIPNFTKIRHTTYTNECITNLRRIAAAKEHWSLENNADDTATPTASDLDPYIKGGTASMVCPLDPAGSFGTSYSIQSMANNPTCKIEPANHSLP